jgi:hypothetical protein
MTGGSNPILRQTDSIRGLMAGLAICLQFQVGRYSTPLTAATAICRASVAALGGSGTSSSNAAASDSASVVTSSSGISASTRRRSAAATESPAARSQFDLWPRYDQFVEAAQTAPDGPDPFTEQQGANPFIGRNALYITTQQTDELPQAITAAFKTVQLLEEATTPAGPILRVFLCSDYQTMPM